MRPIKILLVTAGATPIPAVKGGATETMMTHLIDVNETEKSFDFRIINMFDKEAFEACKAYKHTSFRFYNPGLFDKYYSLIFRFLRKLTNGRICVKSMFARYCGHQVLDYKPDIVLLEGNYFQVNQIRKYVKDCPLILHIHIDGLNNKLDLANRIIKDSDGIIVISKYCRSRVVEVRPDCADKVKVLKNTIDTEKFSVQSTENVNELKQHYNIKPDDIVVTYCGRLCEDKGIMHLMKAVKMLHNEKIKLVIIGTPAYKGVKDDSFVRSLKEFAQRMQNEVIFTGYIPQDQLPLYYSMTSIFVLPSICNEAAGNVIIEALSCGIPVITTTQGGIPEYADEKVSILVDADSEFDNHLKTAIQELIHNNKRYRAMAENARNVALQYDKSHYYSNFKSLIHYFLTGSN